MQEKGYKKRKMKNKNVILYKRTGMTFDKLSLHGARNGGNKAVRQPYSAGYSVSASFRADNRR